ncbi:hypothetical protein [Methylicorpusculum sp.]|nr:hypothetical protein [Methylicorpusculum sp.]MDO8846676.1 hypothetical protein [Methylicorpusculum sp.]
MSERLSDIHFCCGIVKGYVSRLLLKHAWHVILGHSTINRYSRPSEWP